jgi:CDP-diglyceride synthetase
MRRSGPVGKFVGEHEWARFVLLLCYLSALAAFCAWRVVSELTEHGNRRGWLVLFFLGGLVVACAAWPTVIGVSYKHPPWGPAKKLSLSGRRALNACISLAGVVALIPKQSSPVQFWQPGWVQVAASGFWLGFAGLVLVRRVRQRAWRGFSPDEYPPGTLR